VYKCGPPMTTPRLRASRCRLAALTIYLVLGLAALALPIEGSQPLHDHNNGDPGIYRGDCPLCTLAAFQAAAPLPSPLPSVWAGILPGIVLLTYPAWLSVPFARHTNPRAPPLV
jgi:hypothetical protein